MFLELMFFAVLSPLLPGLQHELRLSTSQAGVLVGMYAVGGVLGAVPATVLTARAGVSATAFWSLVAFAASSIAFGLAHSFTALLAIRFLQGLTGATCWSAAMIWLLEVAPEERRGELLGIAFGVSEAGAIAGPVVGGLAVATGRGPMFVGIAVLCLALAFATSRMPAPPKAGGSRGPALRTALSSGPVRMAMWISVLPSVMLAAISVLDPLEQHRLGAGSGQIAATFGVAAALGILVRPSFGRWSDRRGPRAPIRIALLVSLPLVLAVPWSRDRWTLALLSIAAIVLTGVIWAPLMVMLSEACAATGVGQTIAVAILNLTWAPSNVLGSIGGAAIAQAAGQKLAYAVLGLGLLAGYLALGRNERRLSAPATA